MKMLKKSERGANIAVRISSIFVIVVLLSTFDPPKAETYTVIIEIEAVVDYVDDEDDYLEGKIDIGDIITGYYTYESTTEDSNPSDNVGDYEHDSSPYGINLTVGGFVFQTDPCDVDFLIEIVNDNAGLDGYLLRSYSNLSLSNGTVVEHISWQLDDSSMTALSDDELPTLPPILLDWPSNLLRIYGDNACYIVDATVTSAVPEPATILLLGIGTLLLRKIR